MSESVNVVAWSGGLDSTLVLERVCSSKSDKLVWAFSVIWDLVNELKVKQERIARKNYLSYAKKKGYNIAYREIFVKANMGAYHLGCAQALAWLSFLTPYLPEESILYFGYHSGDEFWKFSSSLNHFVKYVSCIGERKIELGYPLKYLRKYDIFKEARERKIPSSCTWTCEKPIHRCGKVVSCGKCDPCNMLKVAMYEFKLRR